MQRVTSSVTIIYMNTNQTTTVTFNDRITDEIAYNAKAAMKFVRRHENWTAKVDAYNAERKAGIENGPALQAMLKARSTSKKAKYHAYDNAARVAKYTGAERAWTIADIRATCEKFA